MSQALIDELTRFALLKNDEQRVDFLEMVNRLGDEEVAFRICWMAYQWPAGTPTEVLDEFSKEVTFKRLIDISGKHGVYAVGDFVVGVAATIPRFMPHGGFKVFRDFFVELMKIAIANGGSLVKYFRSFTNSKALEGDLMKLPGIGKVLSPGLVRDLRLADIIKLDIGRLNLSPSDPVMRALRRTCLIPKDADPEGAEGVLRMKFRIPPMVLDLGVWHIGFYYCREKP